MQQCSEEFVTVTWRCDVLLQTASGIVGGTAGGRCCVSKRALHLSRPHAQALPVRLSRGRPPPWLPALTSFAPFRQLGNSLPENSGAADLSNSPCLHSDAHTLMIIPDKRASEDAQMYISSRPAPTSLRRCWRAWPRPCSKRGPPCSMHSPSPYPTAQVCCFPATPVASGLAQDWGRDRRLLCHFVTVNGR